MVDAVAIVIAGDEFKPHELPQLIAHYASR